MASITSRADGPVEAPGASANASPDGDGLPSRATATGAAGVGVDASSAFDEPNHRRHIANNALNITPPTPLGVAYPAASGQDTADRRMR